MECGCLGRLASRENLVSHSPRFGLNSEEANGIIDGVKEIVARYWRAEVLRQGGSQRDCDMIEPACEYPGFEYHAEPEPRSRRLRHDRNRAASNSAARPITMSPEPSEDALQAGAPGHRSLR
jgi:hypothetical protein